MFNKVCFKIFAHLFAICLLTQNALAQVNVALSVIPQKYIIEKIAQDKANILVMVSKGKSPEMYEPLPSQMHELQKADIYFGVGMPFENKWRARFANINPRMKIINQAYTLSISAHKISKDPHIWLSALFMQEMAKEVAHELSALDSKNKDFYMKNLENLLAEIEATNKRILEIFSHKEAKKSFLVYHDAFGYFATAYGLEELAIEKDGKEAKSMGLQKMIDDIHARGIKTIFLQPQSSQKQVLSLSEQLGLKVRYLDPLPEVWNEAMIEYAQAIAWQE